MFDSTLLINATYVVSAMLFILGLKLLGHPSSARKGNLLSSVAMLLAIAVTLLDNSIISFEWILIAITAGSVVGLLLARLVVMTKMPELVSLLNGVGGLASMLLAWSTVINNTEFSSIERLVIFLALFIGGITFSGSVIAWAKLSERIVGRPIVFA